MVPALAPAAEVPVVTEAPTENAPVVTEAPTEAPTEAVAGTLRIWADEQRAPVLAELGAKFKAEYNVDVVVENISGIRDQFTVIAPAGEGPDIIVIPHDQVPALVASGLVPKSTLVKRNPISSRSSIKAFTYGGKLYGIPMPKKTSVSSTTPSSSQRLPPPGRKFTISAVVDC